MKNIKTSTVIAMLIVILLTISIVTYAILLQKAYVQTITAECILLGQYFSVNVIASGFPTFTNVAWTLIFPDGSPAPFRGSFGTGSEGGFSGGFSVQSNQPGTYTVTFYLDVNNNLIEDPGEFITTIPVTCSLPTPLVFKNQGECVSTVNAAFHEGRITGPDQETLKETCKAGEEGLIQVAQILSPICAPGQCQIQLSRDQP